MWRLLGWWDDDVWLCWGRRVGGGRGGGKGSRGASGGGEATRREAGVVRGDAEELRRAMGEG